MASESRRRDSSQISPALGFPIELRLENQLVAIIGGGRTAMRKISGLLAAGAQINLIDPAPLPDMPQNPRLTHHRRVYRPTDLDSARLVFATTNDSLVNAQIAEDATSRKILCCRVDSAEGSDFITPARLLRPPLSFSVSTGGESPAMAVVLRDLLADMVPPSWQTATELAAVIRRKVLTERPPIPYNQLVLRHLVEQGLLDCLEQSDRAGVDRLLLNNFGAGFTLQSLQFSLP